MPPCSLQQCVTVTVTQQQHEAEAHGTVRSCRRCRGRCSPSPGPQRATWHSGTHTHTHILCMTTVHTLLHNVTAWDPRSQLTDRAALQLTLYHSHTHTYTTSRRGDDLCPGRIITKWYKVTGTDTVEFWESDLEQLVANCWFNWQLTQVAQIQWYAMQWCTSTKIM